jgi:GTP-binding protein Era
VPVSALKGDGLDALDAEVLKALPDGEPLYPDDYLTDQSERLLAAELVRENDAPSHPGRTPVHHGRRDRSLRRSLEGRRPDPNLCVDPGRERIPEPIVIGKGGDMIKRIGTEARWTWNACSAAASISICT